MTHRTLPALIAAAMLAVTSNSAFASDSMSTRAASTLGQIIAGQGNAALQRVKNDMVADIKERVDLLIPGAPDAEAAQSGSTANNQ